MARSTVTWTPPQFYFKYFCVWLSNRAVGRRAPVSDGVCLCVCGNKWLGCSQLWKWIVVNKTKKKHKILSFCVCVIIEAPTWAEPAGAGGLQRQAKETTGSCMYHLSTLSLLLSVFLPSHSLSHTHTLTHFEWSEKYYVSLYFPLFSSALASTYQPINLFLTIDVAATS